MFEKLEYVRTVDARWLKRSVLSILVLAKDLNFDLLNERIENEKCTWKILGTATRCSCHLLFSADNFIGG
jgi:predicted  nucleic acid-binding Zn ribbon protein